MNLDHLGQMPNQTIDGDPQECVALTIADIAGNYDGRLYDPDHLYAMTLYLMHQQPNTGGLNCYVGMQAAIAYGLLPIGLATFTAKVMGELYIANWKNYPADQQKAALRYARKGFVSLPTWEAIIDYMNTVKAGVALHIHWYPNFENAVGPDGILPAPAGIPSDHDVAVYDCVEKDGRKYLLIKPWLGQAYGAGGYALLSREIYETIQVEAYGFDPNASRLISLMQITVSMLLYLINSWNSLNRSSAT